MNRIKKKFSNLLIFILISFCPFYILGKGQKDISIFKKNAKSNQLLNFSFDSFLFGKVPSFFIEEGKDSSARWEELKGDFRKKTFDYFFLIDEINLVLKLELAFSSSQEVLKKLEESIAVSAEKDFFSLYVKLVSVLINNDLSSEKKNLFSDLEKTYSTVKNSDKKLLLSFWLSFLTNDKRYLTRYLLGLKELKKKDRHFLYLAGKMALFYSDFPRLAVDFWDALIAKLSEGEEQSNLFLVFLNLLDKYQKNGGRMDFALSKFYWELKILIEPRNPVNYNNLGFLLADSRVNLDKALKFCQIAVTLDPNNPYYYDSLGWTYYQMGNLEMAVKMLSQAIALKKDFYDAYYHLGTIFYLSGNYQAAIYNLKKATEADSKRASAWNDLGYLFIEKNLNYKKGIEYVKKALSLEADNPFFLDSLGWGYFQVGEYQKAYHYLKKSMELKLLEDNFFHLGSTLVALDKMEELKKMLYSHYLNFYQNPKTPFLMGIIKAMELLEEKKHQQTNPKKLNFYSLIESNLYRLTANYFKAMMLLSSLGKYYNNNSIVKRYLNMVTKEVELRFPLIAQYYNLRLQAKCDWRLFLYWFLWSKDYELFSMLNFDWLFQAPSLPLSFFSTKTFFLVIIPQKVISAGFFSKMRFIELKNEQFYLGKEKYVYLKSGNYVLIGNGDKNKIKNVFNKDWFQAILATNYFVKDDKPYFSFLPDLSFLKKIVLEKYNYRKGIWTLEFKFFLDGDYAGKELKRIKSEWKNWKDKLEKTCFNQKISWEENWKNSQKGEMFLKIVFKESALKKSSFSSIKGFFKKEEESSE